MLRSGLVFTVLALVGCQSLPSAEEGRARDVFFVASENCLSTYIEEQNRLHLGPCLTITAVNGQPPAVRPDGFIELPVGERTELALDCKHRHQDGTFHAQRRAGKSLVLSAERFTESGQRWYPGIRTAGPDAIHQRDTDCTPSLSRAAQPGASVNGR
ncbi:MAG: hypothetical protein ACPHQ9_12855 [Marinobacter sp.]|uniref:hypothetical protein n=1 Tax=Marinobacter sp. TaxID=50741 RepID=UPI003C49F878